MASLTNIREEENEIRREEIQQIKREKVDDEEQCRFLRILGKGSFGFVYTGIGKETKTICAIKIMSNYGVGKSHLSSFFRSEFASYEYLPFHPNVLQLAKRYRVKPSMELLHSALEDPGMIDYYLDSNPRFPERNGPRETIGMALELLPWNLEKFMEKFGRYWKPEHVYDYCLQIANGVAFLYANQVVHLDLKLDNILVSPCTQMVICDFSTALQFETTDRFKIYRAVDEAEGGNRLHLAPELFNSPIKGNRKLVDYSFQPSFALGVLFYEIAAGEAPFRDNPMGRRPHCTLAPVDFEIFNQLDYSPDFVRLLKSLITEQLPRPLPEQIVETLSQIRRHAV